MRPILARWPDQAAGSTAATNCPTSNPARSVTVSNGGRRLLAADLAVRPLRSADDGATAAGTRRAAAATTAAVIVHEPPAALLAAKRATRIDASPRLPIAVWREALRLDRLNLRQQAKGKYDGQYLARQERHRRILFVAPDGKRPTIRLGKVSQLAAESIKYRWNNYSNRSTSIGRWKLTGRVGDQSGTMVGKEAGPRGIDLPPRDQARGNARAVPAKLSGRTQMRLQASEPDLVGAGSQLADRLPWGGLPVDHVTPTKGEAFRQSMLAAGLRPTTIHKRLQHARMFFNLRQAARACCCRTPSSLSVTDPAMPQSGVPMSLRPT